MFDLHDALDIFFEMLKSCIESITLPTGENLVPTFLYSFIIFIASVVSNKLGILSLVDWRGALIATILLLILAAIERRGVHEISRLYRAVRSGTTVFKERAAGPGADLTAGGSAHAGNGLHEESDGLAVRDGTLQ